MSDDKYTQEKKSGLIDVITKAFDRFVGTFRKHGVWLTLVGLLMFMLLYAWIMNPVNIDRVVNDVIHREQQIIEQQKEEDISKRLAADRAMNLMITEIFEKFPEINRILVLSAHNSQKSLNGIPFLYYSASYEEINPTNPNGDDFDLDYYSDNFQRQITTNVIGIHTLNQLKTKRFLYFNNLDRYNRADFRLIAKMRDIVKSKSLMLVPFVTNNIPAEVLILSSKQDDIADPERIYDVIEKFAPDIEKNLLNID